MYWAVDSLSDTRIRAGDLPAIGEIMKNMQTIGDGKFRAGQWS